MSFLPTYKITSPYGNRPSLGDFHHGVDYGTPVGTPLPALVDGVIQFEGRIPAAVPGFSDEIILILQAPGYFIVYGHLSQTLVKSGQQVKQGQTIAKSGATGYVFGAHLHIEKRLGTKSATLPLSHYPSADITPLLQSYGGSMDNEHYNLKALEEYQTAREKAGHKYQGGAKKYARDRVFGGDTFAGVITRDMKNYISTADEAIKLKKQVEDLTKSIAGLNAQLTTQQNELTNREDIITGLRLEIEADAKIRQQQAKELASQREQIAGLEAINATLKQAARDNDAVAALSAAELIRLGILKFLRIGGD